MSWASGKTALVTGGNSGIDRVVALALAAAVMFLGSPAASFVTGQPLILDGGLSITDYSSSQLLAARGGALSSRPEAP